jgi:hypothetical protein
LLASAYQGLGQVSDAEACLRRAIALAERNPAAHFPLGALLAQTSRPEEADACFRQALVLDPVYPPARNALAALAREDVKGTGAAELHVPYETTPGFGAAHRAAPNPEPSALGERPGPSFVASRDLFPASGPGSFAIDASVSQEAGYPADLPSDQVAPSHPAVSEEDRPLTPAVRRAHAVRMGATAGLWWGLIGTLCNAFGQLLVAPWDLDTAVGSVLTVIAGVGGYSLAGLAGSNAEDPETVGGYFGAAVAILWLVTLGAAGPSIGFGGAIGYFGAVGAWFFLTSLVQVVSTVWVSWAMGKSLGGRIAALEQGTIVLAFRDVHNVGTPRF